MRILYRRGLLLASVALLSFLLAAQTAFAGVGLSPASVSFEDMVRGGYAERYITVSNPVDESVELTISAEGDPGGWMTAEPSSFNLSGMGFKIVKVIVRPPDNVPNGIYMGRIIVVGKVTSEEEIGGTGVAVASVVTGEAMVEVSDIQLLQYNVESLVLPNTEECRPILIHVNMKNTGNVNATPRFHVEIKGKGTDTVLQEHDHTGTAIYPTTKSSETIRVPYKLEQFKCIPSGEYTAYIKSYLGNSIMDSSRIDFHIYPRGTLTVGGEILDLKIPDNVTLGEIVKIEGIFKNTGEIPVVAKLNAEVYQGGRLIETVTGDSIEVGMGGVTTLLAYFTPTSGGKHKFLVSASFEDRKSEAKEAEMEVIWPTEYFIMVGVGGAAVAGGAAFFILRKRKKKKSHKRGK